MCGCGSLLLFFCPVSVFSCCFGLVSRDQNFHCPSFFFLGCSLVFVTLTFSLFFLLLLPLSRIIFSFSPLRYSRSGNAATLARLTNVESSLFPSSDQQRADSLDLGLWKWPSAIVGIQGCLEGGCWPVLVRRETHGSLLGVGFWPLVDDGNPLAG